MVVLSQSFSDQYFVATEEKNSIYIAVVRLEDASLSDLLDLPRELLDSVRAPEGSVFLYGSVSYLSRVGTGAYAGDWLSVVTHAESQWRGIRICPLIPMILLIARELSQERLQKSLHGLQLFMKTIPSVCTVHGRPLSRQRSHSQSAGLQCRTWTATRFLPLRLSRNMATFPA
jgi:hypothetical protein